MSRVLALLGLTGCSAFLQGVPEPLPPRSQFRCADSYAAPIVDTVTAATFAGAGGSLLVATDFGGCTGSQPGDGCPNQGIADGLANLGALLLIPALAYGISSIHG